VPLSRWRVRGPPFNANGVRENAVMLYASVLCVFVCPSMLLSCVSLYVQVTGRVRCLFQADAAEDLHVNVLVSIEWELRCTYRSVFMTYVSSAQWTWRAAPRLPTTSLYCYVSLVYLFLRKAEDYIGPRTLFCRMILELTMLGSPHLLYARVRSYMSLAPPCQL
jgi:hypothetical protein